MLDFKPPTDYLAYLSSTEGAYQFGWAYLLPANDLLAFNTEHGATEFYPGYFLIGGHDGEAFAIEKATGYFVEIPLIGHDEQTPIILGHTWHEFLEYLLTEYC